MTEDIFGNMQRLNTICANREMQHNFPVFMGLEMLLGFREADVCILWKMYTSKSQSCLVYEAHVQYTNWTITGLKN